MKTLKEFMVENDTSSDNRTDIFLPYLGTRADRFLKSMQELSDAEHAGQIYNARYKDLKDNIIRSLDTALQDQHDNGGFRDFWFELRKKHDTPYDPSWGFNSPEHQAYAKAQEKNPAFAFDLPSGVSSTASIKKELRDVESWYKAYPQAPGIMMRVRLYKAADAIITRLKNLKDKVIAGREKVINPNVKQKFVPKYSRESAKAITEFITAMVEPYQQKFADNMYSLMETEVNTLIIGPGIKTYGELSNKRPKVSFRFIDREYKLFDTDVVHGYEKAPLRRNWKDLVRVSANKVAKDVFLQFIYKNTSKMAGIFERKGAPVEHKIREIGVNGIRLNSNVYFKLADGSQFDMTNSIVYGYKNGRGYVQFPTRFHNVVKADGKVMASPSEEKMNTEF